MSVAKAVIVENDLSHIRQQRSPVDRQDYRPSFSTRLQGIPGNEQSQRSELPNGKGLRRSSQKPGDVFRRARHFCKARAAEGGRRAEDERRDSRRGDCRVGLGLDAADRRHCQSRAKRGRCTLRPTQHWRSDHCDQRFELSWAATVAVSISYQGHQKPNSC